jgi:hypothetical protein
LTMGDESDDALVIGRCRFWMQPVMKLRGSCCRLQSDQQAEHQAGNEGLSSSHPHQIQCRPNSQAPLVKPKRRARASKEVASNLQNSLDPRPQWMTVEDEPTPRVCRSSDGLFSSALFPPGNDRILWESKVPQRSGGPQQTTANKPPNRFLRQH